MSAASLCRSCGARITWAMTARKRRRVPLDPQGCPPDERGALIVVETPVTAERWAYGVHELAEKVAAREGLTYERAREVVTTRYPAHRSHFSTCPNAREHRQPARSGTSR